MDMIEINGGNRLTGEVKVSGAKNAVLPVLTASLLASKGVSKPTLLAVMKFAICLKHKALF